MRISEFANGLKDIPREKVGRNKGVLRRWREDKRRVAKSAEVTRRKFEAEWEASVLKEIAERRRVNALYQNALDEWISEDCPI